MFVGISRDGQVVMGWDKSCPVDKPGNDKCDRVFREVFCIVHILLNIPYARSPNNILPGKQRFP